MIIINEETKAYKSFQDATAEEIKKYRNQWKVGDKRVEADGATYVIVDTTGGKITVMRSDLIGKRCKGTKNSTKYIGSIMDNYVVSNAGSILGSTFSKIVKPRSFNGASRSVWLPSASEVFGSDALDKVRKDGEQFEYFKRKSNRRLGGYWWTRSDLSGSDGSAGFVICGTDGSLDYCYAFYSIGIVPCFYI